MRSLGLIAVAALLVTACGDRDEGDAAPAGNRARAVPPPPAAAATRRDPPPKDKGTAPPAAPSVSPAEAASPCNVQGEERLRVARLRAVGTEPFWNAAIDGRCVTYSHPEDQKGTRVWTRYLPAPGGGTWTGALGGRRFELRIRPQPGCSDGMSDRRYPLAAELLVGGERRKGCAEPAA